MIRSVINAHEFISALVAVRPCAGTEMTRYYLNGVAIHISGGKMRLIATNGHVMAAWIMRKTKFIGDIDHITVIPSQLLTTIRPLVWSNLRDVRKYNDLNVVIDIDVKPNGGDTDCIRIGFSMRDNLEPCPNMGQISLRSIGGPFPYYQKVCRFTAPESAGENGPVAANGFYLQKAIKFFGHNESVDIVI